MTTSALLCLLALAPPLLAETVVFVGAPPAAGALLVAPDDGGPSVPLAGFESTHLLPLDFHGRCPLLEWMPDRPRLRADLPGAGRLVLPNAQGCLYRYRRESAGALWFGFLYLDPAGAPQARLERPGSGPLANQDPFLSTVAVAPDGAAFLAVTTPDAGDALLQALRRAVAAWHDTPGWRRLQKHGMARDSSWAEAAGHYAALYARIAA